MKYTLTEQEGEVTCTQTFEGSLEDFEEFYKIIGRVETVKGNYKEISQFVEVKTRIKPEKDCSKRPFQVGDNVRLDFVALKDVPLMESITSKVNPLARTLIPCAEMLTKGLFKVISIEKACVYLDNGYNYLPEWLELVEDGSDYELM